MAYGFVSKNDDGEYLITDQTTNLTFVKRVINYHSVSQPFAGFGGLGVFTYRVNNCSSTPIPFFTCPVANKAYSVTQIKPTGTSNQWEVELITSGRSDDKPTSTTLTNATVPPTGFASTITDEITANGYRNIAIRPVSRGITFAGRHRLVPQEFNITGGGDGLSRGGYLIVQDESSYKISTNTHVPYSMEYFPPTRRVRLSNQLKDGEVLFHRENSTSDIDEGNGIGLFQYNGGDLGHWSLNVATPTTDDPGGSMRGAAHYKWWRKGSNSYDAFSTKVNGSNPGSEYISGTNRTRIYVTTWSYVNIRVGQHVKYCTAIVTSNLNSSLGGLADSGWKEIVAKNSYTFGPANAPDRGYYIEVAGNVPLEDEPGLKLSSVDKEGILPGGRYWPYFHLHVKGFINDSGNAANATFTSSNPTYNATLNADFVGSNIDFFPMQLHFDYVDRYKTYSSATSVTQESNWLSGGDTNVHFIESDHTSAVDPLAVPRNPVDLLDTYNFKPVHARQPLGYSGLGQFVPGSTNLVHTSVLIQNIPNISSTQFYAPNTIDISVLKKGYTSTHKILPAFDIRNNIPFAPGIGVGMNGDLTGDDEPIQITNTTSNTITFDRTVRWRRPIISKVNLSHITMSGATNYSNTGNIFAIYRGTTLLSYSSATTGTPAANSFRVGTPEVQNATASNNITPGTISVYSAFTPYFQISNASNLTGSASNMIIRIPIITRNTDDAYVYTNANYVSNFEETSTTYVSYRIYPYPSSGQRVEIGFDHIIHTQNFTSGGVTSAAVPGRIAGNQNLAITATPIGITGTKHYKFRLRDLSVSYAFVEKQFTTSSTYSYPIPLTGDVNTITISVRVYLSTDLNTELALQTRDFQVSADGFVDIDVSKFHGLTSFELATDSNIWKHDGLVTTPNDVQFVSRVFIPGVATSEGTIDNISGHNVEPFYVKTFCGSDTGDGNGTAAEPKHLTWETRYSANDSQYACHEHYTNMGYQAPTTNPISGIFNNGEFGASSSLGAVIANNYGSSTSTGISRSSNDNLQLGVELADSENTDEDTVKAFSDIASALGGQTRGYIRANYGFLDRAKTYNEAIVWNGSIVVTNSYSSGAFVALANPVVAGGYTYTRDTVDATITEDYIMFGVKRYGPYDPADFPSTAGWDVTNIPELFIFSKPSAAPTPHGDHGVQILSTAGATVFDSRTKPLMIRDTASFTMPSLAVSSVNCSSLKANSWGGNFQNHSSQFTPTALGTVTLATGSLPAFFYNTKVQCHQECKRDETEKESDTLGLSSRTYYHTTKYWGLYKGGIVRQDGNTSTIKTRYITVDKGAYYQYRKVSSYLFGGTDGGTDFGYNNVRPWNTETINNVADTVISIDTNVFRGATYQIGGLLDSVTQRIELTGSDRNGSFVDVLNKTIEMRTGDRLELTVNIANNNYRIAKDGTGTGSTYNPIDPEEVFNNPSLGASPNSTIVWVAGSPGTYWYYSTAASTDNDLRGNITVTTA